MTVFFKKLCAVRTGHDSLHVPSRPPCPRCCGRAARARDRCAQDASPWIRDAHLGALIAGSRSGARSSGHRFPVAAGLKTLCARPRFPACAALDFAKSTTSNRHRAVAGADDVRQTAPAAFARLPEAGGAAAAHVAKNPDKPVTCRASIYYA